MGAETAPLLALLQRPRPLSPRLVHGFLGSAELGVVTTGVGPDPARRRCAEALALFRPDRVLNLGTCGALVDGLGRGSLVHVDRLLLPGGEAVALEPLGRPARTLVTVAEGVWDRASREALAARGAQVCEMEAAGVLSACDGLPLHLLKVVSDLAGGAPDAVAPRPGQDRPGAAQTALFKARAFTLVQRVLVPALREVLAAAG